MLQRGIETPDMDVRWVSSLSWYFLNFFGLNGLYRLILGSDNCMSRSSGSFSLETRDNSRTLFLPPHFDSPCTHISAPNPLATIRSFRLTPSDGGFSDCGFFALLCCAISHLAQLKMISGLSIVPGDGRPVRRGDATGPARTTDGLSQDLFCRAGQPPIR